MIPGNFFPKKLFFDIGPLINLSENPDLIMYSDISNDFLINELDFLDILSKALFVL